MLTTEMRSLRAAGMLKTMPLLLMCSCYGLCWRGVGLRSDLPAEDGDCKMRSITLAAHQLRITLAAAEAEG